MSTNSPKAWQRFTAQFPHKSSKTSEVDNFGKLAKWSARFRLAKSFKALDLGDAYASSDTPLLYSAITRIFLVYSAFETYCSAVGLGLNNSIHMKALEENNLRDRTIQAIRNLDPENNLPRYLVDKIKSPGLINTLNSFIEGNDINVSYLARSIRHIFAHGVLSAHSVGLSSSNFDQISQLISEFLLDCMDEDFDRRVPD